jgi:hypothetical protein
VRLFLGELEDDLKVSGLDEGGKLLLEVGDGRQTLVKASRTHNRHHNAPLEKLGARASGRR